MGQIYHRGPEAHSRGRPGRAVAPPDRYLFIPFTCEVSSVSSSTPTPTGPSSHSQAWRRWPVRRTRAAARSCGGLRQKQIVFPFLFRFCLAVLFSFSFRFLLVCLCIVLSLLLRVPSNFPSFVLSVFFSFSLARGLKQK